MGKTVINGREIDFRGARQDATRASLWVGAFFLAIFAAIAALGGLGRLAVWAYAAYGWPLTVAAVTVAIVAVVFVFVFIVNILGWA